MRVGEVPRVAVLPASGGFLFTEPEGNVKDEAAHCPWSVSVSLVTRRPLSCPVIGVAAVLRPREEAGWSVAQALLAAVPLCPPRFPGDAALEPASLSVPLSSVIALGRWLGMCAVRLIHCSCSCSSVLSCVSEGS